MIKCIDIKLSETNPEHDVIVFKEIGTDISSRTGQTVTKTGQTVTKGFLRNKHSFRVGNIFEDAEVISVEYESPLYDGHLPYTNGKYYSYDIASNKKSSSSSFRVLNDYFPIVKIPTNIQEILNLNDVEAIRPVAPTAPKEPEANSLWIIFLILGVVLLFAWTEGGVVIILISVIIALISRAYYRSKLKAYRDALTVYENSWKKYIEALTKYDTLKSIFQAMPLGANQAKRVCIEEVLSKVVSVSTDKEIKRGISEDYFYEELRKWFPNEVYRNLVPVGEIDYRPDFVFKCSSSNLHIDIEIDEPYTMEDGKPIHCTAVYGEESSDEFRDAHFNSLDWIVIRFTELQAVKYPAECCRIIAETIFKITGNKAYLHRFESTSELFLYEPKWDYDEARRLSKSNYRDKYLVDAGIVNEFTLNHTK